MIHSPYIEFSRASWAERRGRMPLTLEATELESIRGTHSVIDINMVVDVYLPLSRLLSLYVQATHGLYEATAEFLGHPEARVPYVIGLAGSVAAGKSTTARLLQLLISRWPNRPKVDLVTTDGFLYPNAVLEEKGLMAKKGFPESYDTGKLLKAVSQIKGGQPVTKVPLYSHLTYDIVPDEFQIVSKPDIVIIEGLNVLQGGQNAKDPSLVFVSDFFDFSIYVDAPIDCLESWYIERFLKLRDTAFTQPESYFHRYAQQSDAQSIEMAQSIWKDINARNLRENILPTRERASLILTKGADHQIERIALRKI